MAQLTQDSLEAIDMVLNEAQAIFAFLDEATDCLSNAPARCCDSIHRETNYGLHLCFEVALERMENARKMLMPDNEKGGN